MLEEFVFIYLLIDAFCLFFSLFIYSRITVDMGTEREVHALRLFITTYAVFLVVDAAWAMLKYDSWFSAPAVTGTVESLNMLLMGFVAYFWFIYAENRLRSRYVNRRSFPLVAAVPVIIMVLLYITTFFTGWVYAIGADGSFAEGPLSRIAALVFVAYVVYTAAHALIYFMREKSSTRKREYLTFVWFAVPPIVFGVVGVFMPGMPVIAFSVFASLLLVFLTQQDARINTDSLTGLNNRRRAVEYAEDALSGVAEDERFVVYMIDADSFKKINDTYGHNSGDRALQIIAEGLRHAMGRHRGLAARWGGDEFLVATFLNDSEEPQGLEEAIRHEVEQSCVREQTEYRISVSIGYAMAKPGQPLNDLVVEADRQLYRQKSLHHKPAKQVA